MAGYYYWTQNRATLFGSNTPLPSSGPSFSAELVSSTPTRSVTDSLQRVELWASFGIYLSTAGATAFPGWQETVSANFLGEVYPQSSGTWPDPASVGEHRGVISGGLSGSTTHQPSQPNLGGALLTTDGVYQSKAVRHQPDPDGDFLDVRVSLGWDFEFMVPAGSAQYVWKMTGYLRTLWLSQVAP